MSQPEISIDVAGDGSCSRVYISGIHCRAVKAVVAYPGGDVMLVLDRDAIRVNFPTPAIAGDQDLVPSPLATDGQA